MDAESLLDEADRLVDRPHEDALATDLALHDPTIEGVRARRPLAADPCSFHAALPRVLMTRGTQAGRVHAGTGGERRRTCSTLTGSWRPRSPTGTSGSTRTSGRS